MSILMKLLLNIDDRFPVLLFLPSLAFLVALCSPSLLLAASFSRSLSFFSIVRFHNSSHARGQCGECSAVCCNAGGARRRLAEASEDLSRLTTRRCSIHPARALHVSCAHRSLHPLSSLVAGSIYSLAPTPLFRSSALSPCRIASPARKPRLASPLAPPLLPSFPPSP